MDKEMNKHMLNRIIELGIDVGEGQAEVKRLGDLLEESKEQAHRLLGENLSLQSDMKRLQRDFIALLDGTANKIQLIKMYRIIMGAGLRESKEGIENSELYRRWEVGSNLTKSEFDAVLDGTATKIQLINMHRSITGEGLSESKDIIESSEFYRRWRAGCMACRDD